MKSVRKCKKSTQKMINGLSEVRLSNRLLLVSSNTDICLYYKVNTEDNIT